MVLELRLLRFMSSQMGKSPRTPKYEPISMFRSLRDTTPEGYFTMRQTLTQLERSQNLGHRLVLSEKEEAANKVIMREKTREFKKGFIDPANFAPGQHIFHVLTKVKKSRLFAILKRMPKGAILHAHDSAVSSTDYLIKLTYRDNLWICSADQGNRAIGFRFSKQKPTLEAREPCEWEPMHDYRKRHGAEKVREELLRGFSMYPISTYQTNNAAWKHFMSIFGLLDGLLRYAPVWQDYLYNVLEEFYEDGVQYVELRSLLPNRYCINGDLLSVEDTLGIYVHVTEEFLAKHEDFIGVKLIYAPLRGVEPKVCEEYIEKCVALKVGSPMPSPLPCSVFRLSSPQKAYPKFLSGFDLVGQEELGRPLVDFIEPLLKLPKDINFYFHAGETNWYGTSIDENLIDAILLGTKRIGHGYALVKHPVAMDLAKALDIAIEVCPVSNQVLQLGYDYRNHPAATLIANDIPIVISSDDPSFWRATPLTHDFYFAFLGIAPFNADLRFLKQLAMNSINYSGLDKEEKTKAFEKWNRRWDKWIEEVPKLDTQGSQTNPS